MRPMPAMTKIEARERLIVPLDVPSVEEARKIVSQLGDAVLFYKIGLELQMAAGLSFVRELIDGGKKVFLDYKYNDIEETIHRAVANVASIGVSFITVHGNGPTIQAAVKARGESGLKILSVTVLTSLDAYDLHDLGFRDCSVRDLVLYRARKALEAGCDGVIASGQEAQDIRNIVGNGLLIVTPGIRPEASNKDDHKRSVSPTEAIKSGADYLVVGRPITRDPEPHKAAQRVLAEMQEAFDSRQ
jgi:orotidine-5'-phosphate decarboxylase